VIAETLSLQQLAALRGRDVMSSDGVKVGEVSEIVYDYATGEPVWIGIGSGLLGMRTLLIPIRGARFEKDHLRVAHTRKKIEKQPHVDIGEGFDSLGDERHLYEYFEVVFDERGDVRVLAVGDELPGLERVSG